MALLFSPFRMASNPSRLNFLCRAQVDKKLINKVSKKAKRAVDYEGSRNVVNVVRDQKGELINKESPHVVSPILTGILTDFYSMAHIFSSRPSI